MKQLHLTNSPFKAIVDDEDYERCLIFPWHLMSEKNYVAYSPDCGKTRIMLHNFILQVPANSGVDHKDRDPLNNTKDNLRITSNSGQGQNRNNFKNNTSGYKGVSWCKRTQKFTCNIRIHYRQKFLGYFDTAVEAALVYDTNALALFGPDARTNFPQNARVSL